MMVPHTSVFDEQLSTTMKVYINDMLVKSSKAEDHVAQLHGYFTFLKN